MVLVIDSTRVPAPVRYEAPGPNSDRYPYIHGPMPVDAVVDVIRVVRDAAGRTILPE